MRVLVPYGGELVDEAGVKVGRVVGLEVEVEDLTTCGTLIASASERRGNSAVKPLDISLTANLRTSYEVKGSVASLPPENATSKASKDESLSRVAFATPQADSLSSALKAAGDGSELPEAVEVQGPLGTSSQDFPETPSKDEALKGEDGETRERAKRPSHATLATELLWAYWLQISGRKQRLDEKRRRILRNAYRLKRETETHADAVEAIKTALLGLTRNPHHQGLNEQRRRYMEIRYALKGIGNESDDERIEKAIAWATIYDPDALSRDAGGALSEAKVQRYLEEVRYTRSLPHRPERDRAVHAYRALVAAGFKVVALDHAPWARLERHR